ncbi:MAG: crosslink repair DNA glycosylase YcaQ family protein [Holophaga sp.]|nr:crosslink repair DNA glycosylase YcaQ family protein [Holophaga sp.]
MAPSSPQLTAAQARRLLLAGQALLGPPPPGGLEGLVQQLGYVQLDSINVVERAHHLILGCRTEAYDPAQFEALLEQRRLFEHWTHDAAAIPLRWYPHWHLRFPKSRARILASPWWRERMGDQAEALLAQVLERIRAEGPLRSADFEQPGTGGAGWWGWKPHKAALELLWHTGELAVASRLHFHKSYDLAERVFPEAHALPPPAPDAHLEWACATALERLGAATPRELAAFWNAVEPADAARWCAAAQAGGRIAQVAVQPRDGGPAKPCFAVPDWRERLAALPEPGERMVILCPFDPILRDRARTLRLFGFDYRFEAFVPEARRQFGYYVLPILEGETLVGRLDAKHHRDRGVLECKGLWWEKAVRPTKARQRRLRTALETLARRIGAGEVQYP